MIYLSSASVSEWQASRNRRSSTSASSRLDLSVDHHAYDGQDVDRVFSAAREMGAHMIITTQKDAVKLPPQLDRALPLYVLRVELELTDNGEVLWQAVNDCVVPNIA